MSLLKALYIPYIIQKHQKMNFKHHNSLSFSKIDLIDDLYVMKNFDLSKLNKSSSLRFII